eukprot:TRINITY_DN83327_c0_g1_i1.p1 TRINITY_DN83327_c0_g1~~TRINITY_DN83327_c0_g1_i1.p1  ORF type:complete len:862 (+),score=128.50 TRINITY_DN83327_c0_g1_i1:107-2692(+)
MDTADWRQNVSKAKNQPGRLLSCIARSLPPYTCDLHGYTCAAARELMRQAFGSSLPDPAIYTFILGCGKHSTKQYRVELRKACHEGLRQAGLQEDRHASAGAVGYFKSIDDNDHGMHTVRVFPKLEQDLSRSVIATALKEQRLFHEEEAKAIADVEQAKEALDKEHLDTLSVLGLVELLTSLLPVLKAASEGHSILERRHWRELQECTFLQKCAGDAYEELNKKGCLLAFNALCAGLCRPINRAEKVACEELCSLLVSDPIAPGQGEKLQRRLEPLIASAAQKDGQAPHVEAAERDLKALQSKLQPVEDMLERWERGRHRYEGRSPLKDLERDRNEAAKLREHIVEQEELVERRKRLLPPPDFGEKLSHAPAVAVPLQPRPSSSSSTPPRATSCTTESRRKKSWADAHVTAGGCSVQSVQSKRQLEMSQPSQKSRVSAASSLRIRSASATTQTAQAQRPPSYSARGWLIESSWTSSSPTVRATSSRKPGLSPSTPALSRSATTGCLHGTHGVSTAEYRRQPLGEVYAHARKSQRACQHAPSHVEDTPCDGQEDWVQVCRKRRGRSARRHFGSSQDVDAATVEEKRCNKAPAYYFGTAPARRAAQVETIADGCFKMSAVAREREASGESTDASSMPADSKDLMPERCPGRSNSIQNIRRRWDRASLPCRSFERKVTAETVCSASDGEVWQAYVHDGLTWFWNPSAPGGRAEWFYESSAAASGWAMHTNKEGVIWWTQQSATGRYFRDPRCTSVGGSAASSAPSPSAASGSGCSTASVFASVQREEAAKTRQQDANGVKYWEVYQRPDGEIWFKQSSVLESDEAEWFLERDAALKGWQQYRDVASKKLWWHNAEKNMSFWDPR